MTQTASDRIRLRMNELKLTQADLMRSTGAARGSVSGWVNGSNSPSAKHIEPLAKALQTTTAWLLTGEETKQPERPVIWGNVRENGKKLRIIPLLDYVQAGLFNEVNYDGIYPKGKSYTTYEGGTEHSVFSLEIEGYSMSPEFQPGDEIVVDGSISPKPGSLVIAQETQHGIAATTFKKYRLLGVNEHGVEIIELVPLNKDYPTYNSTQVEISIIGVVVEHHRNLRY